MSFGHAMSRKYSTALLDAVTEGIIDKDSLITDLVGWLSEHDVQEFCQANDLVEAIGLEEDDAKGDWDSLSPVEKLKRNLQGLED